MNVQESTGALALRCCVVATVFLLGIFSILGSGSGPTSNSQAYNSLVEKMEADATLSQQRNERHIECIKGIMTADFGVMPSNYKSIATGFMAKILKDPDSAKYLWGDARGLKHSYVFDDDAGVCVGYGWALCLPVNAKNSFGGYTGPQLFLFVFRGNVLINFEKGCDAFPG